MMSQNIPKVFKACFLTSFGIIVAAVIVSFFVKELYFATQVGISGGIGIALLAGYMLWIGRTVSGAKSQMESDKAGDVASGVATKIQIASLVRLFATAAILVVLIVAFKFEPVAIIVGISGLYIPYAVVPLLFKSSDADTPQPEGTNEVSEDKDK